VSAGSRRAGGDVWLRRVSALVVAAVAAYASYEHQRRFAVAGGADEVGARLWPLSVDGLVLLATDGLLRTNHRTGRRRRGALWAAFGFGIAASLAANIAAAPGLDWRSVLVAGWPPVALLLAVELLAHRPAPATAGTAETVPAGSMPVAAVAETTESLSPPAAATVERAESSAVAETATGTGQPVITLARPTAGQDRSSKGNAEKIMWEHYERERAAGRTPTGAELDRIAGTNNYGRSVLARWRRNGRLESADTVAADAVGT
jgi:Protein of unknown function (DUF2637)